MDGKLANGAGNVNPSDGFATVLLNIARKLHKTTQMYAKCLFSEMIMIQLFYYYIFFWQVLARYKALEGGYYYSTRAEPEIHFHWLATLTVRSFGFAVSIKRRGKLFFSVVFFFAVLFLAVLAHQTLKLPLLIAVFTVFTAVYQHHIHLKVHPYVFTLKYEIL